MSSFLVSDPAERFKYPGIISRLPVANTSRLISKYCVFSSFTNKYAMANGFSCELFRI